MAEEVEITVELAAEYHDRLPEIEFLIDDMLVEDTRIAEQFSLNEKRSITYTGSLSEGPHTLKIKLKNKFRNQTKLNDKGEIVADQLLHVLSIKIDQIDLGALKWSQGKFYPDKNIRPDLDDVIPGLTCIGYNGEYRLEFSVPTYLWLLEHF